MNVSDGLPPPPAVLERERNVRREQRPNPNAAPESQVDAVPSVVVQEHQQVSSTSSSAQMQHPPPQQEHGCRVGGLDIDSIIRRTVAPFLIPKKDLDEPFCISIEGWQEIDDRNPLGIGEWGSPLILVIQFVSRNDRTLLPTFSEREGSFVVYEANYHWWWDFINPPPEYRTRGMAHRSLIIDSAAFEETLSDRNSDDLKRIGAFSAEDSAAQFIVRRFGLGSHANLGEGVLWDTSRECWNSVMDLRLVKVGQECKCAYCTRTRQAALRRAEEEFDRVFRDGLPPEELDDEIPRPEEQPRDVRRPPGEPERGCQWPPSAHELCDRDARNRKELEAALRILRTMRK